MRRTRIAALVVAAVVASTASAAVAGGWGFGGSARQERAGAASPTAETQDVRETEVRLTPVADAYVSSGSPAENFGSEPYLVVDGLPEMLSYLAFDVENIDGEVRSATLRVYAESRHSRGFEVRAVTGGHWNESEIAFTGAPSAGNLIGSAGPTSVGSYAEVDVTGGVAEAVAGSGVSAFTLSPLTRTRLQLAARESLRPPELVVRFVLREQDPDPEPPRQDLQPPIRAAFFYPWFPRAWEQRGQRPFTQFTPSFGMYDSADPKIIDQQIRLASRAGLDAFIASWWGAGHHTDAATAAVLRRIPSSPNPDFRLAVYYEQEGQSDPSPATIAQDLNHLERFFKAPGYLTVDGKPVVFVWADENDGAPMARRWAQAEELYGDSIHVVLKVFSGYEDDPNQPDSWHQYGPAKSYTAHLPWSAVVSPGFWHAEEGRARLVRDVDRFASDARRMADSGAFWQLVTSWNEWGEGTSIEPAEEWGSRYVDILADVLPERTPGPTPSPEPTASPDPEPTPDPDAAASAVTFAAGGDFGATPRTAATLATIAASDAEFLLALGDLAYEDKTAQAWCEFVTGALGDSFPVEVLVGNHEDDDRVDGFIGDFAACLPDRMESEGTYGAEYYFDVGDNLARVIMIGADTEVNGVSYKYERGDVHYRWLERAIDEARAAGIQWVIVGSHKPCLSAGNKPCEIGQDVYDLLLEKRVDLILHGHDHSYQRSAQLVCATPERFRPECVADDGMDGRYARGAGAVFAIVGATGGGGHTPISRSDQDFGYLAASHGANSPAAGRGYLQVHLDRTRMVLEFIGTSTPYRDRAVID